RLLFVLHRLENLEALSLDVEVMIGARIYHDGRVRFACSHGVDHLLALGGWRPVVGPSNEHQQRADRLLLHERETSAGIDADGRGESDGGKLDAALLCSLEARPVADPDGVNAALCPADRADPIGLHEWQ